MTDYHTAVDQSHSRLPGSPDWNQQFRANLRDRGLCLSVAHERGAMPERYPEGGPFFAPRPWPESTTDGWPDDAEIVWLDHPGAAPL